MTESAARPAGWMIAGALMFATMGTLTHALGPRCDWLFIALCRATFMLITTVSLAWSSGARLALFRPKTLWLRSFAGSFSLVCNFYAMTKLPVADVLTLTNTHPLWIVLLTAALWRRRPKSVEVVGLVLGLIGVALIQKPELGGSRTATFIALASAISTAAAMLGLHRLRDLDPKAIVAHFAGVATLISGVWAIFRRAQGSAIVFDRTTVLLLLGVCVTGTIGQLFLTKAYTSGAPTRVAVIGLSQVVFAMIFDVAVFGRVLTPYSLLGFALVLGPTAVLARRPTAPVEEEIDADL
ncbi:MAG: hypothetical protein NVSMB14_13780 [Isosphaeraceae bacterium]